MAIYMHKNIQSHLPYLELQFLGERAWTGVCVYAHLYVNVQKRINGDSVTGKWLHFIVKLLTTQC